MLTYPTISTIIVDNSDSPFRSSVRIGLRIVLYLYVVAFIRGEFNEIRDTGCRDYMSSCWNVIDICNYFLFIVSFVYWINLMVQKQSLSAMLNFESEKGNFDYNQNGIQLNKRSDYIDVYGVGTLSATLNIVTATNAILSSWKLFAYFRASKKLSLLVSTLFRAADTMAFFLIIIMVRNVGFYTVICADPIGTY